MRKKHHKKHNNALIIFTREPKPGCTKTRLMPYLDEHQCSDLHLCFLRDIKSQLKFIDADFIVSYTGGKPEKLRKVFGRRTEYVEQSGNDLGEKMHNAIKTVLENGYEKVVLMGSDVPEMEAESIMEAFALLDVDDVVLGPTDDGGYWMIGMKEPCEEAFHVKGYGSGNVLRDTMGSIEKTGRTIALTDSYGDIDVREDVREYLRRMRDDIHLQKSATGKFLAENAKISIIIPTYNEAATVEKMKEQLRPYRNDAEIIFVDGGSTDDTLEIIGNDYRVINSEKGRANQMNTAALESSGDILFFLHCDSILPKNITAEIRRCMSDNEYGCFGVKFNSGNFFMWTNRVISNHRAWHRGLPFGDQGIFIDRELFFEIGMFPVLPIMEDYEFGRKLVRYGIRPGKTHGRIETSGRRYEKGTIGILKTEYEMWNLRRLYRRGMNIEKIAEMYRDIR